MITIFNWVAILFMLGLSTLFIGLGLFLLIVIIMTIIDEIRRRKER